MPATYWFTEERSMQMETLKIPGMGRRLSLARSVVSTELPVRRSQMPSRVALILQIPHRHQMQLQVRLKTLINVKYGEFDAVYEKNHK